MKSSLNDETPVWNASSRHGISPVAVLSTPTTCWPIVGGTTVVVPGGDVGALRPGGVGIWMSAGGAVVCACAVSAAHAAVKTARKVCRMDSLRKKGVTGRIGGFFGKVGGENGIFFDNSFKPPAVCDANRDANPA